MNRGRNGNEDLQVEQLLAELGARAAVPDEGDLRAMARAAAAARQLPQTTKGRGLGGRRPLRIRWVGAAVGVALLVGSGLGFGLGSSFTPSGSAGTSFAGTGFLPARSWTVMQSGTVDADGASRAIAANVPLRHEDASRGVPYATLESLPAGGVVIVATFTTRGDPGADFAYPLRKLPLQIASATPAPSDISLPRPLGEYRLQAGVKGTNVDARLYFGTAQPSRAMLAAAQRQLNRLVVAAERVTLFARPTLTDGRTAVELFGSVDNSKARETVTIQARDCGSQFFRAVAGAETRDGGGWSTQYYPRITTTLRAVWDDTTSAQVTIRQQARPWLTRDRLGRHLRVSVGGKRSFWRKKVQVQRRQGSRWATIKTVALTESSAQGGAFAYSASWAKFKLAVPRGALVRAVLPLSEVKPCYLGGISQTVRW